MKVRAVVLATALVLMCGATRFMAGQAAVRQVRGPIWISVPASAGSLQTIQVKAPANGNLIVTVTGTMVYEHTLGTQGFYCVSLSQTASDVGGCVPDGGSDSAVRGSIASGFPTTVPGYGASEQYSIVKTIPVTAGATYTFYVNGYGSGFTGAWLFQPSMTALYVPGTLVP